MYTSDKRPHNLEILRYEAELNYTTGKERS